MITILQKDYRRHIFQSHVPALPVHVDSHKGRACPPDWESIPEAQILWICGFASGETDFDKSKIWQNHRSVRKFVSPGANVRVFPLLAQNPQILRDRLTHSCVSRGFSHLLP
jgi:hypothetical protein